MISPDVVILVSAALAAAACGLLGPFLVLRREALLSDAVSHAVLPGIVLAYLLAGSRATLPAVVGATAFAVACVLGVDALRRTGLVRSDAAIGLVFPALFALGVLGVTRFADDVHLDLDATLYGELAFAPLRTTSLLGVDELPTSFLSLGGIVLVDLVLVVALFKELRAASFDPDWAATAGISPQLVSRLLLVAVAVTAVGAFEAVGAILVVTLLVVPAATARLLCDGLAATVVTSVLLALVAAVGGYAIALALDASIAGAMGLVAGGLFALAWIGAPRHGLLARA